MSPAGQGQQIFEIYAELLSDGECLNIVSIISHSLSPPISLENRFVVDNSIYKIGLISLNQ